MDQEELKKIMDAYGEHLLRMAFFYLRDREMAKDIVQDVFLAFYTSSNYEERGTLRAYLTKITVNRCKDHLRSWSFRNLLFSHDWLETIHKQQDPLILKEERTEIAAFLALSENTVKSRMVKARKLLREKLKSEDWEVLSIE